MKTVLAIISTLILLFITSYFSYHAGENSVDVRMDTIYAPPRIIFNTIRDTIPEPVIKYIVRSDTVYLKDTAGNDVPVEIPITAKLYEDSTYRAQVSGFMPRLDWIEVYQRTVYNERTIYQTQTVKTKPRWGVGVQLGYGYAPIENKASPYVGIGLQYNLFTF